MTLLRIAVGIAALAAVCLALWELDRADRGLERQSLEVEGTPVTVVTRADAEPAPAVVIAHGFAGSRQLMDAFSVSVARQGYVAVSFDFRGHGRNAKPLTGDVTETDGATRTLVRQLDRVIAFAREVEGADGSVALLGHSMATDVIVRRAAGADDIAATIAVSMGPFTVEDVITPEEPANLLVITGEWEAGLRPAALEAAAMVAGGDAREGETYGDFAAGTARRAAVSDNSEHLSVLYDPETLRAAVDWLDRTFGRGGAPAPVEVRGPWLLTLFAGLVALAWPLAGLLPRIARPADRSREGWRWFLGRAAIPMVLTPLVLWPVPTGFLPVLVADYLALHFAVYGAILGVILLRDHGWRRPPRPPLRFWPATLAVAAYGVLGIGLAIDAHFTAYLPHAGRWPVILALLPGTVLFTLTDEAFTRGPGTPVGAYPVSKILFLVSLAIAVALDLEDLFFLIIIVPLIVAFFLVYGLISGWVFRRTGHPGVAALANAAAFAWALGVTFPLLGG